VVAAGVLVVGGGAAYALGMFGGSSGTTPPAAVKQATSSLTGLSGAQIVARARAAALQAGAVHVVVTTHAGSRLVRFTDDSYRTAGIQHVSVGAAHAEVRVIGHTTYFTGNRKAITGFFGMPASSVPPKGVWYRLTADDQQYKTVTEGVTLASGMNEFDLKGTLTVLPLAKREGVSVVGVRETNTDGSPIKTVTTLWVAATGPTLPVEYDDSEGPINATVMFSDWGRSGHVAKPARVSPAPGQASTAATLASARADADMRSNLRNLATAEEVYLTDSGSSYATATQLTSEDISYVKLVAGQSVAVHINGGMGFCLAGRLATGRYFIYSSQEGGIQLGEPASDTCSASLYPTNAGTLRAG
jgi:hypothetical protein